MYKYPINVFMLMLLVIAINGFVSPVAAYEFSKMPNIMMKCKEIIAGVTC